MNPPRIHFSSLFTLLTLITIGSAINPPNIVTLHRSPCTITSVPQYFTRWKHRKLQQETFRNLIHFYFIHEQCRCANKAIILNQEELLEKDEYYIACEKEHLTRQERAISVKPQTMRKPAETRAPERPEGFFDVYYGLFKSCTQTPFEVNVDPARFHSSDGGSLDPIWSLYVQIEELWKGAENYRDTCNANWPNRKEAKRLIRNRSISQAADEASRRLSSAEKDTSSWLDTQIPLGSNAQDTLSDDRVSRLLEERKEPCETQHGTMSQEFQTGLSVDPGQDMSNHQTILPDPLKLYQPSGPSLMRPHASADERYDAHKPLLSFSDYEASRTMQSSSIGLPSIRSWFGYKAGQPDQERMDATPANLVNARTQYPPSDPASR